MPATVADLMQQREEIDRQIAEISLAPVTAASDMLAGPEVGELVSSLKELAEALPDGAARTQIGNVVTVLTAVPTFLCAEVERLTALTQPEPSPEAEPVPTPEA